MDIALIGSAIILFVFGVILLLKPDIEKRVSDWLNRNLFSVEDKMRSSHKISGILLIMLGVAVYYLATKKRG